MPSGFIKVLTFLASIWYNSLKAFFIWGLFALISTIKVKILLSSIFFIAVYDATGYLIIAHLSKLLYFFPALFFTMWWGLIYNVFGLLNVVLCHTLYFFVPWIPFFIL